MLKKMLYLGIGLIMSLGLVACGTSTDTNKMRTFESEKGSIEIPVSPERIVTDYYLGDLLALDVKPVGGTHLLLETETFAGLVDGITDVGDFGAVSFEKVAELNPDLIITLSASEYDKYSEIAPTILITSSLYTAEERLTMLGDIVNKKDKATEVINAFNVKIDEAKVKLEAVLAKKPTVSIIDIFPNDIYVLGNIQAGGPVLYDKLGFAAPERVTTDIIDKKETWLAVSIETVPDYAGDYIFQLGYESQELTKQVTESSIWQSLPATKNNQVFAVPSESFRGFDYISLDAQVDIIVESFLA